MHNFKINEAGELIVSPAISSSASDFDFYFGIGTSKIKS